MGFGLIIAGLFFVFNPYINVIDVLPDLVGYLLILAGTAKISMLNADVMTSRRYFGAMTWISAARIAAALLVLHFNDGFLTLTLTLIFAVAVSIYAVKAFTMLFNALDTMSCMAKEMGNSAESVRQFTPFAIISVNALSLVPELTELSAEDELGNSGLVAYKSMFLLVCVVLGLIIGAVWLVMAVRYINALSRSKTFVSALETRYENEIANNTSLIARLDLTSFVKFLPLPLVFLLQFNFDGYYIVPEFLCPLIFAVLLFRIRRYVNAVPAICTACASGAVLLIKYIMLIIYSGRYGTYAYPYEAEGFLRQYLSFMIPAVKGYALLAAAYFRSVPVLSEIARLHTGEPPRGDERIVALNERVSGELTGRYKTVCILTAVLCLLLIASSAAVAFFNMGYIFAIAFDAAAIAITYSFCSELSAQITRRYT